MDKIQLSGMILSVMPMGEYDRRVTILTKERGKIAAFAKGARRQNSKLLGCTQPFVFAKFSVIEGKTSYTIIDAEVAAYFPELRSDIARTCYGAYFCEFADYMTREGNDERAVLTLLYQSLRALTHEKIGLRLTRTVFEWKMLYLNGEGPQVQECVHCRSKDTQGRMFSVKKGGYLCKSCAEKEFERKRSMGQMIRSGEDADLFALSDTAWYTLQYIAATPSKRIYTFTVAEPVLEELEKAGTAFRGEYLKHTFQSLKLLKELGLT